MNSEYKIACLKGNPFEPAIADARAPQDIILVGTHYFTIKDNIINNINNMTKYTKSIIILSGEVGSGKTAIIKRAFYEMLQRENIENINCGITKNKILLIYKAITDEDADEYEKSASFNEYLIKLLNICLEELKEELNIINKESTNNDPFEILIEKEIQGVSLALDQLERIEKDKLYNLHSEVRDLFNKLGTNLGFILILSQVRGYIPREIVSSFEKYIGNVVSYEIEGLTKDEIIGVTREILQHYRFKKEELPECTNINPYYPFENIDILKQLVDTIFTFYGNIERIKPRLWYNIMSKILEQAVLRGYIPINKPRYEELLDYVGLRAIIEWNNYLSYRAEKEELIDALKTAFILFKLMGSSFSIHEKVTMVNDALLIKLSEILFGEKLQLSEDEKNIINKLADLLLIIRIENIVKFIAIKVTTRATKPLIEEPLKIIAEKQIEGIKYKGQLYSVKDLYYLIITFSELPKTVEETLDTYEVIVPFNILEPLIIDRNSETSYGALLLIYNKCSKNIYKCRGEEDVELSLDKIREYILDPILNQIISG